MAVVFAGSTVIPSFVITNPNNFPVTTPRKHDRGFILMLCFRSISKTLRRSARLTIVLLLIGILRAAFTSLTFRRKTHLQPTTFIVGEGGTNSQTGYGWVGYILLCAFLLRTFWYVLPPNYRSDPPDEKLNSTLLLSRRTYPPRDSWNFPPLFFAGTKSPLTTNQQTSSSGWVLPGRSEQQGRPRRRRPSWAAVSRSRGRSAPCPRRWVICSHTMLLQLSSEGLAGERSQSAAENKTASERTFVRFFSTKKVFSRIKALRKGNLNAVEMPSIGKINIAE
ncbi:LOW QUALITY PROTEIN: uncharacterized protein [Elaeis guineensis]|uniref:LOW QUALITY PROTEIN: uncharacterized protein n=1 Tax=Elaeis guineensis var. tenera TaxID=51953 RepID=UPI003C6D8D54